MPRVTLEVPHGLGKEEALQRVKGKIEQLKQSQQGGYTDLYEQWDGETFSFKFRAVGMRVGGKATVEDSVVIVAADLPLAAMMFKGKIEQGVRQHLGALLA